MKNKPGMKTCPNCKSLIGGRTILCNCGYHYPSKGVRKDLLKEKLAPKDPSAGQGKKFCKECKVIIGARTQLCSCGYHYPSGQVRNDLLAEKKKKQKENLEMRTYTETGQGRKTCPGCKLIIGGTIKLCKCGFDFIAHKKEVDELREKEKEKKKEAREKAPAKISPLTAELLAGLKPYVAPPILTKKQHSERIINLGVKRATILLNLHKVHKYWPHVDWDYVERKLAG